MTPAILAVPKNRLFEPLLGVLARAGIVPAVHPTRDVSRRLLCHTNQPSLDLLYVKNWDAIPLLLLGGVHMALLGSDVVDECACHEVISLLDVNVGRCRLVLAGSPEVSIERFGPRKLRVASTYPKTTVRYFAERNICVDVLRMSGGVEVTPSLGVADVVVDIVETGATLRAHGLVELDRVATVGARLVVAREFVDKHPGAAAHWTRVLRMAVQRTEVPGIECGEPL